ncbi:DNA-directed RNA polymerase subunit delta [Cytobacillus sp. NCCP-133]|uniref:DNA-directed RNA polymerase subunit delta n=1 Tax=Cytobacillus sp. NCCP-133 TaxID=766848 RepID=UPI0022320DB0|nr:DNA-directed RNA polymerase subunit delta [Cytobacillus sp. NCCP-133]GLB59092.1 hypothetical protein NCCP133_12250 [Cytobacillus sp. NCCP-133]
MSLEQFSKEELQEMSLIEVAYELLKGKKEPMAFNHIMSEVAKILNLSEKQVKSKIAQFYTDLNIDGHFIGLGDNRWGLRSWYPVDQYEEEIVTVIKPKKKKGKKKADDDDLDLEDYDELDEEDIDYDDIDGFEDDDLTEDGEDDDLLDDDDDFEDDDDVIDKEEEYDLGDDDEELEEDDLDVDEDEEDL